MIDDELMICEAISSYLKKHGFNVFTANTGNDGLRILKEQEISFIILDLMLPDMSGEEICRNNICKKNISPRCKCN